MKNSFLSTTLLCTSFLFLAACSGPKDSDKIADAQSCLDTAKPAEAPACVSKVDGIDSEGANLIRCAGKFVKEGFSDPAKLAATLNSTTGGSGGGTAMMAALAFTTEATVDLNATSAQSAFDYCTKAKSKGMIFLSGLTNTSTSLAKLAGSITTNMTGDDLKNMMGNLQNDPNAQAVVGTAIATIYTTSCTNNGQTAGDYCDQFQAAIDSVGGAQNTNQLGAQVMKCYNNPALPECAAFAN